METMEGEQERTHKWRYRELRRAGYDKISADIIASSEADLHSAVALIKKGCEPALAVKILT